MARQRQAFLRPSRTCRGACLRPGHVLSRPVVARSIAIVLYSGSRTSSSNSPPRDPISSRFCQRAHQRLARAHMRRVLATVSARCSPTSRYLKCSSQNEWLWAMNPQSRWPMTTRVSSTRRRAKTPTRTTSRKLAVEHKEKMINLLGLGLGLGLDIDLDGRSA